MGRDAIEWRVSTTHPLLFWPCLSLSEAEMCQKVDDLATSYLMNRFYRGMQQTDKLSALRKAQMETHKKYPHPYNGASFQLTGSARQQK